MDELRIAEEEQLRILPNFIGTRAADSLQMASLYKFLAACFGGGGEGQEMQTMQAPVSTRGSLANPYRGSRLLDDPRFIDDRPARDAEQGDDDGADGGNMRLSRVLSAAPGAQPLAETDEGFAVRISQYWKVVKYWAYVSRTRMALSTLMCVVLYAATIFTVAFYEESMQTCPVAGGTPPAASNPLKPSLNCGANIGAWGWLVGLDFLVLACLMCVMKAAGVQLKTPGLISLLGNIVGGSCGWAVQVLLAWRISLASSPGCSDDCPLYCQTPGLFALLGAIAGAILGTILYIRFGSVAKAEPVMMTGSE